MSRERARRAAVCLAALALTGALAACGDDGTTATPTAPATAGARSPAAPALLREPARDGEIVVDGEASPETHGPFRFAGRYVVRFAQYAPEDPALDFAGQTPFVARLGPARPGPRARWIDLFEDAARTGRRTIDLRGSHTVDVEFGDFPYVVRFTPTR